MPLKAENIVTIGRSAYKLFPLYRCVHIECIQLVGTKQLSSRFVHLLTACIGNAVIYHFACARQLSRC